MFDNFHFLATQAVGDDVLSYRVPKANGEFGIDVDVDATIVQFDASSKAPAAGLQVGDEIVAVNGIAFSGLAQLSQLAARECSMVVSVRRGTCA